MSTFDLLTIAAATIIPACLVSILGGYIMRALSPKWGLVDQPNSARKVHTHPTPLGGGVAIWFGVLSFFIVLTCVSLIASAESQWLPEIARQHVEGMATRLAPLWWLLGGATVLMIVGLMDDRWGLHWAPRLVVQFGVAAVCVVAQGWQLTAFIPIVPVTYGLSVVWIVALINSFNMLDNMDGASAGVAAIASCMLAMFLLSNAEGVQVFVGGFLLVLLGSLLGFIWHNRPPAKLFMGDAGSYFIGFCVAVSTLLATYTSYQSPKPHALLAPVCVMAVPLYDMVTVLWIRIRSGRSPFQPDKNHFSHRLVELGLSKSQAVLTIYLTTATCGFGGLVLRQVDEFGAVIIILMVVCVLALIGILETTARRKLQS